LGDCIPDVATYSHGHADHAGGTIPPDVPRILENGESATIGGVKIISIPTCEKNVGMKDNWSYLFEYEGIKILHLADAQAYIDNIDMLEVRRLVKET
jgi:hypothetical protein